MENSTLPLADSEAITDIFKHCVNINENLRGQRNIEITTTDANVHRSDTDVIMQESIAQRHRSNREFLLNQPSSVAR